MKEVGKVGAEAEKGDEKKREKRKERVMGEKEE